LLIVSLYSVDVFAFYMFGGFKEFWKVRDAFLPLKMFVLAFPAYATYLWLHRHEMIALDYHMVYLPYLAWYGTWVTFALLTRWNKGGANCIVEMHLVGVLAGIYLLRFSICRRWPDLNVRGVAWTLFGVWCVAGALVAWFTPTLPD